MSEDHFDDLEHYNYDPIHSGASGKGLSKKEKATKEHDNPHTTKEARLVEDQITNQNQKKKDKIKKQSSKE